MRTERRQELLKEMEIQEKERRKEGFCKFTRVLSIIYVIIAVIFAAVLYVLDMLPLKYFIMGVLVLALVSLFIVPVLFSYRGKTGRKIFAMILSFAMIASFGVGIYYISGTMDFMDQITEEKEQTEDYYVLVRASDSPSTEELEAFFKENGKDADPGLLGYRFTDICDIQGMTVASVLAQDMRYSEAKVKLQDAVNVEYSYYESPEELYGFLLSGTALQETSGEAVSQVDVIFISAAMYQSGINHDLWPDIAEEAHILYTVSLPMQTLKTIDRVDVSEESFNIYISGTDLDGYRSDVNMIATVNPVSHQVLLTSIPRDYYVYLPSKEANDKLTHSSLYGVEETVAAVEHTLGVNINYYVRVNYSALKAVVNALGGIDVESEYTFTTSGMQELNGHYFVKGMNHMDGDAALAFCRERHSFSEGDMQRNENQQAVLEAILKKATSSTAVLTSYTSLLQAIGNNMTTNMTAEEMSLIVKSQVTSMPDWSIEKQAIKGQNSSGYCYALGGYASIVDVNPEEDAKALDKIVKTMMPTAE